MCLHALTVSRTLEDEDSVNLAFGVENFDVRHYAPHPPGYPVYIAFARISTAAVGWLHPDWTRTRKAAAGLVWLAILSGAMGIFAIAALWRALDVPPGWAALAAIAAACSPLYWFTAARPLTDVPGLAAAVAVQAALLHGRRRTGDRLPVLLMAASAGAGLAIGVRSQTFWLTMPVLAWVLMSFARQYQWRRVLALTGLAAAGVLVWFVPLVWHTGGLAEYREVSRGAAGLDIARVQLLITDPSWALLRIALDETFLAPWRLLGLPWLVMAAAFAGLVRLCAGRLDRSVAIALVVAPYLIVHVLVHEVESLRYALPVTVVVAGLACLSLAAVGRRIGAAVAVASCVAMVVMVQPVTAEYARGWPVFQVVAQMRATRQQSDVRPVLAAHNRAWWASARTLDWFRERWDVEPPPLIIRQETMRLVRYWQSGAVDPIWLLSDPQRTDLARFDPASRVHETTHQLPNRVAMLVGGLRTYELGWWRLSPPGWMLGSGWSTTRELAQEPGDHNDAEAYISRSSGTRVAVVGVQHLERAGPDVDIVVTLDGREIDRWTLGAGRRVARWMVLPEGSLGGDGAYARLLVSRTGAGPDAGRLVAFDQFDASNGERAMVALGEGWSEVRGDASGPEWRRAARVAQIEVRHAGRPVHLKLRGTLPPEFDVAPALWIYAGKTLIAATVPAERFEISVVLSPDQLDAAGGVITLDTDLRRSLVERRRGVPPREFGVRVMAVELEEVATPIRP